MLRKKKTPSYTKTSNSANIDISNIQTSSKLDMTNLNHNKKSFINQAKAFDDLYKKVHEKAKASNKQKNQSNLLSMRNGYSYFDPCYTFDIASSVLSPTGSRINKINNYAKTSFIDGRYAKNYEAHNNMVNFAHGKINSGYNRLPSTLLSNPLYLKRPLEAPHNLAYKNIHDKNSEIKVIRRAFSGDFEQQNGFKSLLDESMTNDMNSLSDINKLQPRSKNSISISSSNLNTANDLSYVERNNNHNNNLQAKSDLNILSNHSNFRRKSCHCKWCGGISNLELKVAHLPSYIPIDYEKKKLKEKELEEKAKILRLGNKKKKSSIFAVAKTCARVLGVIRGKSPSNNALKGIKTKISGDNVSESEMIKNQGEPILSLNPLLTSNIPKIPDLSSLQSPNNSSFNLLLKQSKSENDTPTNLLSMEIHSRDQVKSASLTHVSPRKSLINSQICSQIERKSTFSKIGKKLDTIIGEVSTIECSPQKENIRDIIQVDCEISIGNNMERPNKIQLNEISYNHPQSKFLGTCLKSINPSQLPSLQDSPRVNQDIEIMDINPEQINYTLPTKEQMNLTQSYKLLKLKPEITQNILFCDIENALIKQKKSNPKTLKKGQLKHILEGSSVKPYYDKSLLRMNTNHTEAPNSNNSLSPKQVKKITRGSRSHLKTMDMNSTGEISLGSTAIQFTSSGIVKSSSSKYLRLRRTHGLYNQQNMKDLKLGTILERKDLNSCILQGTKDPEKASFNILKKNSNINHENNSISYNSLLNSRSTSFKKIGTIESFREPSFSISNRMNTMQTKCSTEKSTKRSLTNSNVSLTSQFTDRFEVYRPLYDKLEHNNKTKESLNNTYYPPANNFVIKHKRFYSLAKN